MNWLFYFSIFFSSLSFSANALRPTSIKKVCKDELVNLCDTKKPLQRFRDMRACLMKERLFISIKCEDEIDYEIKNYSQFSSEFLKICRSEVIKDCSEDEFKDLSFEKFSECTRKFKFDTLSKKCQILYDNYHK